MTPPPPPHQRQPTNPAFQASVSQPIPLPRSRDVEPKKSNPLLVAVPILLVLAGGGYFAFQKLSEPKPAVVEPTPETPGKNADAKKIDGKKEAKQVTPTIPTAKVDAPKLPPVEPPSKEAKVPDKAGAFAVHFSGIPAGTAVTVDGDAASACKSPCSLTLPKGRHTLTGVMDGFSSIARSFEVTGETNVAVDLVEAMGFLNSLR